MKTKVLVRGIQKYLDVHDFEPVNYDPDNHVGYIEYCCAKCNMKAVGHSEYPLGCGVSCDTKLCPPQS